MHITVMHNPKSGDELPADDLVALLKSCGYDTSYVSTKARGKLKQALQDPGDFVVAAGGDGTVERVARLLAGSGVPLAILPFGTANNVAKSLGLLGPVRELAAGWQWAERRPIDLGVARTPWGERRFIESLGAGVFAYLIGRGEEEVDENPLQLAGNEIDRGLLLLRDILESAAPTRIEMMLDGEDLTGEYLLVEAMNIRLVGPNIPLAPNADPSDGLLDVVTVGVAGREALLHHIADRLNGAALPPTVDVHRGRHLVFARAPDALHVDDGLWPKDDAEEPSEDDEEIEVMVERGALEILLTGDH